MEKECFAESSITEGVLQLDNLEGRDDGWESLEFCDRLVGKVAVGVDDFLFYGLCAPG
jgi:hypothetical protein